MDSALPAAAGRRRVMAVVDHRPCGLAAVREAAVFAAWSAVPLTVTYHQRPAAGGYALSVLPLVVPPDDELESDVFLQVAAALVGYEPAWDFLVIDGPGDPGDAIGDMSTTTLFLAGHRRGHPWIPPRRMARIPHQVRRGLGALVVVSCDRRRP